MSEHSGGAGWWQASDGKWYPPAPDALPQPPLEPEHTGPKWWQRSVPLWALILAAILGLALGAAAGGSDRDETATVSDDAEVTATERETTTTERETTTTERETTTTAAPTTTALTPEERREVAKQAFGGGFDATRGTLADLLNEDRNVETLDQLTYDAAADLVTVAVTSTWASPDNQHDGAWEISRMLATLYERDEGPWWSPDYVPNLTLVNSGTRYNCGAELMVRLGSLEASRDHWEAEC